VFRFGEQPKRGRRFVSAQPTPATAAAATSATATAATTAATATTTATAPAARATVAHGRHGGRETTVAPGRTGRSGPVEPGSQFRGFCCAAVATVVARHRPVTVPVRATAAQQQQGTEELLLDECRRQRA